MCGNSDDEMATENGKKGFLWKTTKMGGNGNDKSADGKGQKKEDRNNKTRTDSLTLCIGIFDICACMHVS